MSMDQNDTPNVDLNSLFADAPTDEGQRKVSGKTVPTGTYLVHFGGAKAKFSQGGTPTARPWAQIKEGQDGTVGELVSADLYLAPSLTTFEDGVKQAKTPEKLKEQAAAVQKNLNRIARIGQFGLNRPTDLTSQQALDVYTEQFGQNGGFDAIIEIRESTEMYQGVESIRNKFVWESMAALTDIADDKKLAAAGKTALDEARAKIEKKNAVLRKNAPKTGTAAAGSRPSPESLFS